MSVYTNQTNANATSFFPGLGGGSNFPTGIDIGGVPIGNFSNGILFGNSNAVVPITAQSLSFGMTNYSSGEYNNDYLTKTGLTIQGNTTQVNYSNVIQFNSAVAGSQNDTLSYFRVSTIATAVGTSNTNYEINMVGLASTLKSLYPSIVQ